MLGGLGGMESRLPGPSLRYRKHPNGSDPDHSTPALADTQKTSAAHDTSATDVRLREITGVFTVEATAAVAAAD